MSKKPLHPFRVRCTVTITVTGGNTSQSRTTRDRAITIRATSPAAALERAERELQRGQGRAAS